MLTVEGRGKYPNKLVMFSLTSLKAGDAAAEVVALLGFGANNACMHSCSEVFSGLVLEFEDFVFSKIGFSSSSS